MQLSERILLQVVRRGRNDLSLVVKERIFGTRPRVLLRSVYPIYMSCCEQKKRRCIPAMQRNDCMGGNALKIRSNDWRLRSAKARGLWVVESGNESSSTPEYEISEDPQQWLVTPMCQRMTSQRLRHQGKFLICLFSLKMRSNDWWLRCARAWKVVQVLEQVSNAPDTSEVLEKRWELRSTRVRSLSGCQSKSLAY